MYNVRVLQHNQDMLNCTTGATVTACGAAFLPLKNFAKSEYVALRAEVQLSRELFVEVFSKFSGFHIRVVILKGRGYDTYGNYT